MLFRSAATMERALRQEISCSLLRPPTSTAMRVTIGVIGFFALVEIATLFQNLFGYEYRLNAFVGGVALSLAVIPIIYTVTDDALSAIPSYMSEASLALGATRWQTISRVVLPNSVSGRFCLTVGTRDSGDATMRRQKATRAPSSAQSVRTLRQLLDA